MTNGERFKEVISSAQIRDALVRLESPTLNELVERILKDDEKDLIPTIMVLAAYYIGATDGEDLIISQARRIKLLLHLFALTSGPGTANTDKEAVA